MKTDIPAHTQITCDRCEVLIDPKHQRASLTVEESVGIQARDNRFLDLCDNCLSEFLSEFDTFLEHDRPKLAVKAA